VRWGALRCAVLDEFVGHAPRPSAVLVVQWTHSSVCVCERPPIILHLGVSMEYGRLHVVADNYAHTRVF